MPSRFSSKLPGGSQASPIPLKLESAWKGGFDPGRGVGLGVTAQLSRLSRTASTSASSSWDEQARAEQVPPGQWELNTHGLPASVPPEQIPRQSPSQASPKGKVAVVVPASVSVCALLEVRTQLSVASGIPSPSRSIAREPSHA